MRYAAVGGRTGNKMCGWISAHDPGLKRGHRSSHGSCELRDRRTIRAITLALLLDRPQPVGGTSSTATRQRSAAWAMRLPDKHRYVVSVKQSKRVWEFGWDLLPALER